jgi:hypothetical protein
MPGAGAELAGDLGDLFHLAVGRDSPECLAEPRLSRVLDPGAPGWQSQGMSPARRMPYPSIAASNVRRASGG